MQTEVQTASLEALIKELVATNHALQSDRTDMVKELEAAKGRGDVLQQQLTALQTILGELEEDRNFLRGTIRSFQAAPAPTRLSRSPGSQ